MTTRTGTRALPGRPEATTRGEIERAAFRLFADHGFDGTTLDMIAAEVGVSRRTLFRYFTSKNDIPWGDFAASLSTFGELLAAAPHDRPLWESVHRAVVVFNDFDAQTLPLHRQRMSLILGTPALQAHSVLQYKAWRDVIADFIARRTSVDSHALTPQMVGHVSLALSITAYDQWLADDTSSLVGGIDSAMKSLQAYLGDRR